MLTRQIFGPLLLCADVSATVIHRTDRRTLSRCHVRCLALDCLCGFICPNAWSESYKLTILLFRRVIQILKILCGIHYQTLSLGPYLTWVQDIHYK